MTCLTADTILTADPGVASLILAQSHTFVESDHELISTATLFPSADQRKVFVCYKRKYAHKVLVNCLVKLAQAKSVVRCTDLPNVIIAVDWDVKHQTKPKNRSCNKYLYLTVSVLYTWLVLCIMIVFGEEGI